MPITNEAKYASGLDDRKKKKNPENVKKIQRTQAGT